MDELQKEDRRVLRRRHYRRVRKNHKKTGREVLAAALRLDRDVKHNKSVPGKRKKLEDETRDAIIKLRKLARRRKIKF